MRLLYAGTQLGVTNGTRIVPSRTLLRNARNLGYGFRWSVDVDAYLYLVDNEANTTTQMTAVELLLSAPGGDLEFQYDSGTDTVNSWLTANTFTGVVPTFLGWGGEPGAQFRTWRSFKCRFEFDQQFSTVPAGFMIDFKETIRIRGGTSGYVVNEYVNGVAPDSWPTVGTKKWTATQAGRAVGLSAFPASTLFPPIWGNTSPPLKDQDFAYTSPEAQGATPQYRYYECNWNYSFEAPTLDPTKRPNLWT